jgi:hypothetical protein
MPEFLGVTHRQAKEKGEILMSTSFKLTGFANQYGIATG